MKSILKFFILTISILTATINSNAQRSIRTEILQYYKGEIYVEPKVAEVLHFSKVEIPIFSNNRSDSRSVLVKISIRLKDGTKTLIETTSLSDTMFLFEQFDGNGNLEARGFITPELNNKIEGIISILDPITGEETIYDKSHFKLIKTGSWQILENYSKFEIGSFNKDKKDKEWYVIDPDIPIEILFKKRRYDNGRLLGTDSFGYMTDSIKTANTLNGSWYLFNMISKNSHYFIASKSILKGNLYHYVGQLDFQNNQSVTFKKEFRCLTGVNLKKENDPLKWQLRRQILSFGNYELNIAYIDEDKIIFEALNDHIHQ